MAGWFPFHYQPVNQWHAKGLPISTASDEAAKCLDAGLAQLILLDEDPHFGGMERAMEKALAADPDFFFAKVVAASAELQGGWLFKPIKTLTKFNEIPVSIFKEHLTTKMLRSRKSCLI